MTGCRRVMGPCPAPRQRLAMPVPSTRGRSVSPPKMAPASFSLRCSVVARKPARRGPRDRQRRACSACPERWPATGQQASATGPWTQNGRPQPHRQRRAGNWGACGRGRLAFVHRRCRPGIDFWRTTGSGRLHLGCDGVGEGSAADRSIETYDVDGRDGGGPTIGVKA